MTVWFVVTAAQAADPEVGLAAIAGVADQTLDQSGWIGVQGGIDGILPLGSDRFTLGGRFRTGASLSGPAILALEPVGRIFLVNRQDTSLAATLGAGVTFADEPYWVVSPGLTVDVGPQRTVRPRFEAAYHLRPSPGEWRVSLAAGIVWRNQPKPKIPEPEPEPEPEPLLVDGMLWFGAPVCAWLEPDQVIEATKQGKIDGPPQAQFGAGGMSAYGESGADGTDRARTGFDQVGNLVIAAWPGDVIELAGERIEADANGFVVLEQPEGDVQVAVVGGGRQITLPISIADEHALWMAVDPPQPVGVFFDIAVSELDDEARATVQRVAQSAGDWTLEVRGGASPEGDPVRNAALSIRRAQGVAQALRDAGVSSEQVRVAAELDILDPDGPPEEMRAAIIYPVVEGTP